MTIFQQHTHFDPHATPALSKQAAYRRRQAVESADCGPIDASRRNDERRESCRLDLHKFLTTYFPHSTGLRPFSEDHRRVIERIQGCILGGGRVANVCYRGFSKTTISENAAIWAALYGHRRFVPIFAANATAARGIVRSLKRELSENDMLADDFPEIIQPIQALEGKPQRCQSQTCDNEPTFIEWTADRIVFPTIPGAVGGGAVLCSHGLTSGTLGLKHKRSDGTQQRPDFALIDDPQTRQSAAQPAQCAKRMEIIKASILKMAGHRAQISCVVNATVIAKGDLADTLLDHKQSSAWQSERIPMVKSWADAHETLWMESYATIRRAFDPELPGDQQRAHRAANEFYAANRTAMDAGCSVSWEWCYAEDTGDPNQVPELSAIQHAYNSLIDDGPETFASECQCQPLEPQELTSNLLSKELIVSKFTAIPRDVVPQFCERVTAAIDVGGKILWWAVVGWQSNFSGHVIAYGSYPQQSQPYFTNARPAKTIRMAHPNMGEEGAVRAALEQLTTALTSHAWTRTDGTAMRIERIVVDAGWLTDVIYSWREASPHAALITPSHGRFFGATSRVMLSDFNLEQGERRGLNWLFTRGRSRKRAMHLLIDSNATKSFLARRLETAPGDIGSLTLFNDPGGHAMLIDHLLSEKCAVVKTTNRTCEEWTVLPARDNHWLDVLALNCAAASFQGCSLGAVTSTPVAKQRVKFSELQRAAKARGGGLSHDGWRRIT